MFECPWSSEFYTEAESGVVLGMSTLVLTPWVLSMIKASGAICSPSVFNFIGEVELFINEYYHSVPLLWHILVPWIGVLKSVPI